MLDRVLRFFITLFLAIAGGALLDLASPVLTMYVGTEILKMEMGIVRITMGSLICILLGAVLGGLIGFLASPYFIRCLKRFSAWVEQQLGKMPIHDVIAGAIGLAIGLIIANLLGYSFAKIPIVGDYIPVIFSIVFGYLGITITIKKRQELTGLFDFVPRFMKDFAKMKEMRAGASQAPAETAKAVAPKAEDKAYKLLDTSVIIDGRIADICDTGFIEGTLLIPVFVLEELQHIADSSDVLKRTRVGLHLRAVGENPQTADAAGIDVNKYKYIATCVGSMIAGLGGLYYVMDYACGVWSNDAFGDRGWLAIALVIFTVWKPNIGVLASFLFGGLYILHIFLPSGTNLAVKELYKMIPYVVTIIVLIITSVRSKRENQPPASLGLPYFREER